MPRGYLKHSKTTGRKQARGGSSGKGFPREVGLQKPRWKGPKVTGRPETIADVEILDHLAEDEISSPVESKDVCHDANAPSPQHTLIECKESEKEHVGSCLICSEQRPLIRLTKNCLHESACRDCLRSLLVERAQKDVKNYPLTCFHPYCSKAVHVTQLEKHKLVTSKAELAMHHRLTVLAKREKASNDLLMVECPNCKHPRVLPKTGLNQDQIMGCFSCSLRFLVSPDYVTIKAMEAFQKDKVGNNDGWARCPKCKILISKGFGCDHMRCLFCENDFSWEEAREIVTKYPLARPPDDELYMWW